MLSSLNSNPNVFVEILFIRVLFDNCLMRRNISLTALKIKFFNRINSDKFTTKFLFYYFLSIYFVVNISVALSNFINFFCKVIVIKIQVNPIF